MNRVSVGKALGWLRVRGMNWAFAASSLRKMIGNWEWSIHPRFQLMRGWTATNHGYPNIALFSPMLVKKNRRRVCCGPVRTCRSVKYWSSPLLLGVLFTLNNFRVTGRCRMGRWRYLAYSKFMKFLVAPESIRAMDSALLDLEWIKNRIVIDFRSDMYTFESWLHLISADLIKHWENPEGKTYWWAHLFSQLPTRRFGPLWMLG